MRRGEGGKWTPREGVGGPLDDVGKARSCGGWRCECALGGPAECDAFSIGRGGGRCVDVGTGMVDSDMDENKRLRGQQRWRRGARYQHGRRRRRLRRRRGETKGTAGPGMGFIERGRGSMANLLKEISSPRDDKKGNR